MVGRVVSTKMQKTAVVKVESRKTHPLYKKSYVWSKKYLVDDPVGVALGDLVEIVKVAPISKRKHWRIIKVVGKDFVALGEEHMKEKAEEAIAEVLPEEDVQKDSESSESQKVRVSDKSDISGKQSPSESSEKKVVKARQPRAKKAASTKSSGEPREEK